MPRGKRKQKAPPRRVWVGFDAATLHPTFVVLEEKDADPMDDEVVYRFDIHE